MRLTLGSRPYDLTTRALVMGTVDRAGSVARAVEEGADIVEVVTLGVGTEPGVPLCVAPAGEAGVAAALAAGASLVRLGAGISPATYRSCGAAGAAVLVAGGADGTGAAEAAGMSSDRIVVDGGTPGGRYPVLVDVTGAPCPAAATAVAVVRGARIVRTADIRGALRICDVLAAVWEAQ